MKTTLVNHSGIIQDKFIIRNSEDLEKYESVNAKKHGEAAFDFSDKPNRVRDLVEMISENEKQSMFVAAIMVAQEKIMKILQHIQNGNVVVVNMAGGYTFWDDRCMSLVDESERLDNDSEYLPKFNIGGHEVLILENQEHIPTSVIDFVTNELFENEYSSIIRLNADYNKKIGTWITEAIKSGCRTIVTETQLMDRNQILDIANLFLALPPMNFYVLGNENLKGILIDTIGEEKTNLLYNKHNIKN